MGVEQGATLLFDVAKVWGIPYALFIGLLFYVLYKNDKREEKSEKREASYQSIISKFGDEVSDKLDTVHREVTDIRQHLYSKL